ncbi:alpha/beta hydrolase [Variovorax sp. VNK109]|uniref:alpha/beta hydrolase n=1 Tax=Variovorax sp. VNK109 TaxID=3400919 RepID=UPI003C060303
MTRRTGLLAAAGALLAGCSGTQALNALVARDTYTSRGGIAYGTHPRQKLDVYKPLASAHSTATPPVVLFFYGGSWTRGERADYRFVGESLASQGVITVVADYRLSPEVRWREIAQDSALAARWVFDNLNDMNGDPKRVFVMGHSAGGWNAAMLALDARWLNAQGLSPRRFAGWIGLAGAYDFLPIENPEAQVAFNWPDTPPDSQPLRHVSKDSPPALLIAPDSDKLVNPERNTEGMARALRAQGVPVTVHRHSAINHVTLAGSLAGPLRWLAPVRREVLDFIAAPAAAGAAR